MKLRNCVQQTYRDIAETTEITFTNKKKEIERGEWKGDKKQLLVRLCS